MSPRRTAAATLPKPIPEETEPESRKQAILDAATEIFHRKGYHATSIQDIAHEVGMLKGSLYYYIDSKHELLLQIITDVHAQAFSELQGVIESDAPPSERLRQFIVRHAVFVATHRPAMGVFLHEYKSVEGPAKARVMAMRDLYETILSGMIEEGQEDGSFRKEVNPKLTVKLILGMVNWLYHWYAEAGPMSPEEIGQAMADMALRALG